MLKKLQKLVAMTLIFAAKAPIQLAHAGAFTQNLRQIVEGRAKHHASAIMEAIQNESIKSGFDPVLILSIIATESQFSVRVRGRHGEIGLMQIKPSTARWIALRNGLSWGGSKTLEDPAVNIELGVAYLSFLRKEIPSPCHHYLSAYNMGLSNLRRALQRQLNPQAYASRIMHHFDAFSTIAPDQPSLARL